MYKQLSFEQFGSELIKRRDVEPVHEMLFQSRLKDKMLHKWLVAFWLFRHAGLASKITESRNFREACLKASESDLVKMPLTEIENHLHNPSGLIELIARESWFDTYKRAKQFLKVGDDTGFQIAVTVERCLRVDMDFSGDWLWFFNEPRAGALTVFEEFNLRNNWLKQGRGGKIHGQLQDRVEAARKFALGIFEHRLAPPDCRRVIDTPEIATIFAKYRLHRVGQYAVGSGTKALIRQLGAHGDLANELKQGII